MNNKIIRGYIKFHNVKTILRYLIWQYCNLNISQISDLNLEFHVLGFTFYCDLCYHCQITPDAIEIFLKSEIIH